MRKVKANIAISVDGYVAGPNQSVANPIGEGGMQLHEWMFPLAAFRKLQGQDDQGEVNASTPILEAMHANVGAVIMGRNMFGPIRGDWRTEKWEGWWGDDPPYHMPVFVLTHHEREPIRKQGGTTFHFVTGGIESALGLAREAAGAKDVLVAGGASAVRQYLAAGLIDEIFLHVAPVVLGAGERLFQGVHDLRLEQLRAVEAPGVAHLEYRVLK